MRTITEQYAGTADPVGMGLGSLEHYDLGYAFTLGQAFPLDNGFVLQRRPLYPVPGEWRYCGYAREEDAYAWLVPDPPGIGFYFPFSEPVELVNDEVHLSDSYAWLVPDPPGIGFYFPFPESGQSDAAWQYRAARVLGNGFGSEFTEATRVDFDAYGTLIEPPLPVWPAAVSARAMPGGKVRVTWSYESQGQGGWPSDFQVFESPNWEVPLVDSVTGLAVTPFDPRRGRYEFTTGAFADGSAHAFGVRARNATGVAERNVNTTPLVTARAATPAAARVLTALARR